jgi:hypothetical protein
MKFHLATVDDAMSIWQVHKLNCQDVERLRRQRRCNAIHVVEAESPAALVKKELDEELRGMGYEENDFRIMPCCK